MFPFILGLLMGLVGVLILLSALTTPLAEGDQILPKSMVWRGFGARRSTLIRSAILAAGVTVAGCLQFSVVLNVPFPLFRWGI